MTDYANMQAGPEMDALVAEPMGLRFRLEKSWRNRPICQVIHPQTFHWAYFEPSTNDADACRVLGKLGERCDWEMDYFGGKEYTCTILVPQHVPQTATAPTLALAICRAALMTTQGKEANDEMAKDDMRRR